MDGRGATCCLSLLLLGLCGPAASLVFSRCGLVYALRSHGFPETSLRNWVCLVESESGRNTDVISGPNRDGSHDYGLFQINDRYWCAQGAPGGVCHVKCQELAKDDIDAAARCALKVYARQGFWAWYGWRRSCYRHILPDISFCDDEQEPSVLQV